jgi:hypothetical protein
MYDTPSTAIGRAHLLSDIIDNLENISGSYYKDRTLSYMIKENHLLYKLFKSNN